MDTNELRSLYNKVFVLDPEGAKVLEDLTARFYDREVFVSGGTEGERQTLVKIGCRRAIAFILKQCALIGEDNGNNNSDNDSSL